MRMHPPPARALAAGLAAGIFAGCASYEPMPLDPARELQALRARATEEYRLPDDGRSPAHAAFALARIVRPQDGLTLAEASSLALAYAPALAEARLSLGVAQANTIDAGKLPNPTIYLGPRWGIDAAALVLPFQFFWTVPLGGRLDAEAGLAGAQRDGARLRVRAAELEVLGAVRRLYIRHAVLERERAIRAAALALMEKLVRFTEDLVRAGAQDDLAAGLSQLAAAEARLELRRVDASLSTVRYELLGLLGLPPYARLVLVDAQQALRAVSVPSRAAEEAPSHPALLLAAAAYRASEEVLRLEVANAMPDLQIGPDGEHFRADTEVGLGVTIEIPLFRRNEGPIEAARQRRDLARVQYQAALGARLRAEAAARERIARAEAQLAEHERALVPVLARTEQVLAARIEIGRANVADALAALAVLTRMASEQAALEGERAEAALDAVLATAVGLEGRDNEEAKR